MTAPLTSGTYKAEKANLAGSEFHGVNLSGAKYEDVNLRDSVFENVAFTRARIRNACLGDVSIEDANYAGMRIDGILVTELLRTYRESHPAERDLLSPPAAPTPGAVSTGRGPPASGAAHR